MLQKSASFPGIQGPIVTIVMDGYGIAKSDVGSAIAAATQTDPGSVFSPITRTSPCARTALRSACLPTTTWATPKSVTMPSAPARSTARARRWSPTPSPPARSGKARRGRRVVAGAKGGRGVLHFLGLFSDGNVHSHVDHLRAMIVRAKEEGVKAVRIHILLDGRDVPETSALDYVLPFEAFLGESQR
jgi:2,3-bisphosphoglycerate-independent phosphoglycerate mutase